MESNIIALGRTKNELVKLAITIFVPLLIMFIPTDATFTPQMRLFFVITLMAIISFATGSLSQTGVALALPIVYILTGLAPGKVAYGPWTNFIPWMVIGGLLLSVVLEHTGLLNRIAYRCILLTGASYKGIIWGLTLSGVILNILMPAQAVIPMAALAYGICKALNLKPGKATAGITLSAAMASLLPLNWLYNSNLMIVVGLGIDGGGPKTVGWLEVFTHNIPMILYSIVMAYLCTIVFKPDQPISGKEYFQKQMDCMGKMSKDEQKALVITLILFVFLITGSLHHLEPAWGFALIPCLFFLPGVDLVQKEDIASINWGFVFFITACLSIGTVAGYLGIGKIVAQMALPILSNSGYYVFFLFVWILFFLCNFLLTPLAMEAAFTQPLTEIALNLNIDPMSLYYVIMNAVDQVVLPYEYALYLIFFSFGLVRVKDFAKIMSVKIIVNFVLVFALLIPYWNLMGYIYLK